jgi:hypothetical protein
MIKVWHRRCGKDLDDFAFIVDQMLDRVGNYWHIFPLYTQGRKAVWEGFTSSGKRYIDHVPKELIKSMDKNQMTFELVNGSIFRIVGADNPDSMVGAGPVGAVFSEYSLIRPSVWGLMEPMLLENGGWARFNMTPRGENHAYEMLQAALKDIAERGDKSPWFVSILTIRDTGIITEEQIEDLRRNGRSEELIQQEYYCSFAGALEGAYYSRQMAKAAQEGRITSVPHDPSKQVFTFWDLGMNDPTCIWFVQDIHIRSLHRRCLISFLLVVVVSVQLVTFVDFNAHVIAQFLEGLIGHAFPFQLNAMRAVTLGRAVNAFSGFKISVDENEVGVMIAGVEPLKAKKKRCAPHSQPITEAP